jgi:hypothetical protein
LGRKHVWLSRLNCTNRCVWWVTSKGCSKSAPFSELKTHSLTDICASLWEWTSKWPSKSTTSKCSICLVSCFHSSSKDSNNGSQGNWKQWMSSLSFSLSNANTQWLG